MFKVLFFALIASFTSYVNANVYQEICEACINDEQFENIAYRYAEQFENQPKVSFFNHQLYIYNYSAGIARTYLIKGSGLNVMGEPGTSSVQLTHLTNTQKYNFSNASHSARNFQTEIQTMDIPDAVVDSAYALVGASYKVNDLAAFYNGNASITQQASNWINSAGKVTGVMPAGLELIIIIKLSDDSTALMSVIGVDGQGNLTLKFISGKDKDNNNISTQASHYQSGAFRFTQQGEAGINKLISAAGRAGVPIAYKNTNIRAPRTLTCAFGICNITGTTADKP